MASPAYNSGNITREVASVVEAGRLVKLTDGKVELNDASTLPYGVTAEKGIPKDSDSAGLYPYLIRVNTDSAISHVETDEETIVDGSAVYAAAEGKVAASGSVAVGRAHGDVKGGRVKVHLFAPVYDAISGV